MQLVFYYRELLFPNQQVSKRDITLVDKSGRTVSCTLWGSDVSKPHNTHTCTHTHTRTHTHTHTHARTHTHTHSSYLPSPFHVQLTFLLSTSLSSCSFFGLFFIMLLVCLPQAEGFDATGNPVVAVKGAKVSDFNGVSLSVLNSSVVNINPDIPDAHQLRGWYERGREGEGEGERRGRERWEGGGESYVFVILLMMTGMIAMVKTRRCPHCPPRVLVEEGSLPHT